METPNLDKILEWLTSTVPGVIILGAAGSILGALFLSLGKRILKKANESKELWILRLLFPLGRESDISEDMRDEFGPEGRDAKFIVYHTLRTNMLLGDCIIFFLFLTLTGHVAIAYGIDRPILLSALIALNLLTLRAFLKQGMRTFSLTPVDIDEGEKRIVSNHPKKWKDWRVISGVNPKRKQGDDAN